MAIDGPDRVVLPYAVATLSLALLALYAVVAWWTSVPLLILVLNGLSLSAAAGLFVLYAPMGLAALSRRRSTQADWFAVGLLALSVALGLARVFSILGRDFAMTWIFNTDLQTGRLALTAFAMLCFLIAPYAGMPPHARHWRALALWVAAGVALVIALLAIHHGRVPPLRFATIGRI